MTLIGQSRTGTTIDGENQNWIFSIQSGVTVKIQNLTFKNGNTTYIYPSNGGAIYNIGNLTVENCAFVNNTASYGNGGAIYNTMNGNLTLNNCTFTGNNANDGGGAIYNGNPHDGDSYTATLNATGCSFINNAGKDYGGAIQNNQYSICILNDSIFTNNTASGTGGGAIWNNHYSTCTITGCDFTNNTGSYGGAIMNYGILTIIDSNFINNTANVSAGAIMQYVHTCTIENCTFTGNTARSEGGAICNWGNSSQSDGTGLNITSSTFTDNKTIYNDGGAISNRFSIQSANTLCSGLICILTNCIFNNNTAHDGGAIHNYCYVAYSGTGGSITCNMTGCTFNNNTARNSGGAIFNNYNVTGGLTPITSIITDCIFNNNTAINGGAVYNEQSNLTCTDCTFTSNTASVGGAIYNGGTCTLSDCNFTGNTASVGGAIYNGGTCTLSDCNFTGNTASVGDEIYNYGICTLSDCNFTGNTATCNSAIYNYGTCTLSNCNFIDNTAIAGGAIFNYGTCTLSNCNFTGNTAIVGGAIYNVGTCTVHFSRFFNNTASLGSAICSMGGSANVENNWWSSNNPNWSNLIFGFTHPVNWVILTVNATPNSINNTQTSIVTADFNHINGGGDLIGGHIPDGPITLNVPWGSFTGSGITHSITLNTIDGVVAATFHAKEGAINPLFNPVMVTATADGYTTNDTESAYITINPAADISVNQTFEDTNHNHITSANYQDTIIIHLNVTNNGPDTADWVVIDDIIPSELDDSSFDITSNSPGWGYVYYSGSQRLTVYITNIANGASYDVWINLTNVGHNNNLITNTAQLNTTETYPYDPNSENNNSTDSYTANASADVGITKEFRNIPWGDVITNAYYNDLVYAIVRVSNLGPDPTSLSVLDSLTGITWTGTYYVLPYLIPNIQENWIVNDTTNTFNGTHWNIPLLGSGLGGTVKWLAIEGIINRTGPVSNYAETVDQSAYPYKGYASYTAYLTADAVPTNLTIDNARGNKNETVTLKAALKDHQSNPLIGKTVEFWVDGIKVGENITDINGTATFNYIITQTSGNHTLEAVFNGNTEYLASNVTGQLYVPKSDLYLKITSSNNNPKLGQTFIITYKLGNNGPDEAKKVIITIPLPEGFKYTDISGDGNWTYNASTNTITWTLTNVPVGDPYLYISGYVNKPGTYIFSSSISSETYNINTEGVTPSTINAVAEVKAASKTIGMQNTGLPISGLIVAILAVFSGLATSKISNFGGSKNLRFFSTSKRK